MQRADSLLLADAPIPVAIIDGQGGIAQANRRFAERFGAWQGRSCFAVLKGRAETCPGCGAQAALREGAATEFDAQVTDLEGAPCFLRVRAVPLGDGARIALLALDRTRVAALEEELRQSERMARVGLSAAGLAHDIKNILAGLEGSAYAVSSGLEKQDLPRVALGWDMVEQYLQQASALVRNLLDYAREQEPVLEEVRPGELVERAVGLYRDKASLVGVEVEGRVAESLPALRVDPRALDACLANLVSNALDACIWDPDTDKAHEIRVEASLVGGLLRFAVRDNGKGISEEDRPKILRTHFTSKGIRGTGLGLLLSKKAVEQHGGQMSFSSQQGQGSVFRIELPFSGC